MPTINFTSDQIDPRARTVVWPAMANGDDGAPHMVFAADKSVQVAGTFGASGTLVLEGSNDGASPSNWFTLTDPQGNALSFTAAKIEQISEYTRWVRPRVTNGDGTTALTVRLYAGMV
jgi:hypothetical protein